MTTTRHSARPEQYGELSERQMAREVGDFLKQKRGQILRMAEIAQSIAAEARMLVGEAGRTALNHSRMADEVVDKFRSIVADTITRSRCDTPTAAVAKRCDRLMGHGGLCLYSDTRDEDWTPRIPPKEMD